MTLQELQSKEKKSVILCIEHYAGMSQVIAIRMTRYRDHHALLLATRVDGISEISNKLCSNGVFDRVMHYDVGQIIRSSDSNIGFKIVEYFDGILGSLKDLVLKSDCYIVAEHTCIFGEYLYEHNKKFFAVEMTENLLSNDPSEGLLRNKIISREYYDYQKRAGVISTSNSLISPIYCPRTTKYPPRDVSETVIRYDYRKMLDELHTHEKELILSSFPMGEGIGENVQLVLLNRSTTVADGGVIERVVPEIYRTIMEYFCDDNYTTLIKQHPGDAVDLSNSFVNTILLDKSFPLELIRLHEDIRVSKCVGFDTTSANRISDIVTEKIIIDWIYRDLYRYIHQIYIIFSIMSLSNLSVKTLYTNLTNKPASEIIFFKNILNHLNFDNKITVLSTIQFKGEHDSVILSERGIGDNYITRLSDVGPIQNDRKSCIVIINPTVSFVNKYKSVALFIKIEKNKLTIAPDGLESENPVYLMFITENSKMASTIKSYKENISTKYCGIEIKCYSISADEIVYQKQASSIKKIEDAIMNNDIVQTYLPKIYEFKSKMGGSLTSVLEKENLKGYDFKQELSDIDIVGLFLDIERNRGKSYGIGYVSDMYRDGKGVEKDLLKAATWIRMSISDNPDWANNKLFNILWKINTSESHKEMISIATESAKSGNNGAMMCLGKAYRYGKGVEKDLYKAAEWTRKVYWGQNQLFDILWSIDTSESLDEMIDIILPLAESENGDAMGRLGKAYRYGKGVETNINRATEWLYRASLAGVGWAKYELFDMLNEHVSGATKKSISIATEFADMGESSAMKYLGRVYLSDNYAEKDIDKAIHWMRKVRDADPNSRIQLFELLIIRSKPGDLDELEGYAKKGDDVAIKYLSKAYRHGKGVEKNLSKAAGLLREAADKGIKWANDELLGVLWEIGSPVSYSEMILRSKLLASRGNGLAMKMLGLAYRDGKGVEKDFDEAIAWMRKAYENTWWRGIDLANILLKSTKEEHHREAFIVCYVIAEEYDSSLAMGFLGRMYRDGKGVEKDLENSACWFKNVAEIRPDWVFEAVDVLLMTNNSEYWSYAFNRCMEVVDEYPAVANHIVRMYRDGKGVEKNIGKATEWMRNIAKSKSLHGA